VRAALVASRDEGRIGGGHFFHGGHDVTAFGAGRVGLGADQHEVVVHDLLASRGKTVGHKLLFGHLVVHEEHVGIAPARHVDGLARAQRDHLHVDAAGSSELGQQKREQARLLGGRGGRHHDALGHRAGTGEQGGTEGGDEGQTTEGVHKLSP